MACFMLIVFPSSPMGGAGKEFQPPRKRKCQKEENSRRGSEKNLMGGA